ncbi:MAG: hypothetical protein ABI867_09745 [Kofleriaceae bacterium]
MRTKSWAVAAIALTSCWKSGGTTAPKHPGTANVDVALASVTLGNDCNAPVAQAKRAPEAAGAVADSSIQEGDTACEQSAIVLALTSTGGATKIKIKKVEVVDSENKPLGTLTFRKPALWQGDTYVAWDEALAEKQTAQVSYDLTEFDWNKVPGGRYSPTPLTVRVTLEVGSEERTVEKQTQLQAMPDPDVVT